MEMYLSPLLSNIFQNDLHDIFDEQCDPISIGSAILNSISWADDLILISSSKEGLQRCLDLLFVYCKKWGLEVNVDKTKTMVFSKQADKTTTFNFNDVPLKNVQEMVYLGFNFSYNGNTQSVMSDRISKAKKVAGMVLNALRSNKNISTKLALSIYDKQIAPVMMYGCSIWSVPKTGNLLYLENQPENSKVRKVVDDIFIEIFGETLPYEYAKRVGKIQTSQSRRILIKLRDFDDKRRILSSRGHNYEFSNYVDVPISDSDKEYLRFCKSALNTSKYASNSATCFELGVKPIDNKMHGLAIKYWLRLENGPCNYLLNEAYKENKNGKFEWSQNIMALLYKNGYGYVWKNPSHVDTCSFHKEFRERLDMQFVQNLTDKIETSTRFDLLRTILDKDSEFKTQPYITLIKNPTVREIFTRLRTDINILESCKSKIGNSPSGGRCTFCPTQDLETPYHTIFVCENFENIRQNAYMNIKSIDPVFDQINMRPDDLINYVLNLKCPEESVRRCCGLVGDIYEARVKLSEECEG